MKKVLGILAAVLVLGAVALAGLQPWGFSLLGVEFAWSPEYREVQQLGRQFMEDIEFKDWDRAASYHTWAEKQEADIPEQIRRLFGIKPEQLHIENVRLMGVDISEDEAKSLANSSEAVQRTLDGKAPRKVIYVPRKLVNIVA